MIPGSLCMQRKIHYRALQHCRRQHGAVLSKALCTDRMRATGHHHREDKKSHDNKLACGDHLSPPRCVEQFLPLHRELLVLQEQQLGWDCLQQCDTACAWGRINRAEGKKAGKNLSNPLCCFSSSLVSSLSYSFLPEVSAVMGPYHFSFLITVP